MSFNDEEFQAGGPALDDLLRLYMGSEPRRFGLFGGQYQDYMRRTAGDGGSAAGLPGPTPDINLRIPSATERSGQPPLFPEPDLRSGGGAAAAFPAALGRAALRPTSGAGAVSFTARPDPTPLLPRGGDGVVLPELVVTGRRLVGTITPPNTGGGAQPSAQGRAGQDQTRPANAAPGPLTADRLRGIMPLAGKNADVYADALNTAMRDHGITSPYEQAAFLAQIGQESGQLRYTRESMNYRPETAMGRWPNRFATLDAARPYAHNPEALGNRVYAGRNGNGDSASGDGYRYRGGGLLQVTGRGNYRLVGHENDPEALAQPAAASGSATAYWRARKLGDLAGRRLSRAEFDRITRKVNGGMNGGDERWAFYNRALDLLAPD